MRSQVNAISCNSMYRGRHYAQENKTNKWTNTFRTPWRENLRNAPTHTLTQMICASQCDHMVWRGLPTHRRGSVRLQCTVQLSAITSCLPALNGNTKPALLSPVTALKLNQAERRQFPIPCNQHWLEIWWAARNLKQQSNIKGDSLSAARMCEDGSLFSQRCWWCV